MKIKFKITTKEHYFKDDDFIIKEGELIGLYAIGDFGSLTYLILSENKLFDIYQKNIISINGVVIKHDK